MVKNFIILPIRQIWRLARALVWVGLWLFGLGLLVWYFLRWWPPIFSGWVNFFGEAFF